MKVEIDQWSLDCQVLCAQLDENVFIRTVIKRRKKLASRVEEATFETYRDVSYVKYLTS